MADIAIPGISDKYKTNDLVNSLVEVEKIPLKREQEKLDGYKFEQTNWRRLNQYMSSLRESARKLYSFDNPFSERTATSSDERAITASPTRDAALESFKIDVEKIATSDRFLSKTIDKNQTIPEGIYKFTVADKTITYRWKGGKISDFSNGLNKRGNGFIKSSFIGVSKDQTAFLIESLKTGNENKLVFEDDALKMAFDLGIIEEDTSTEVKTSLQDDFEVLSNSQKEIEIPTEIQEKNSAIIRFKLNFRQSTAQDDVKSIQETEQQAEKIQSEQTEQIANSGKVTYNDITIYNASVSDENSYSNLEEISEQEETPAENNKNFNVVILKMKDGSTKEAELIEEDVLEGSAEKKYSIKISDNKNIEKIIIENNNAGKVAQVSDIHYIDTLENLGYKPVNPISVAGNAKIKYEGITMERPSNEIDDVVENIKLELHEPTSQVATITVQNDVETSKDALINFVGNYNQLLAELNILTQLKPEIIDELDYLSDDDKEKAMERLGAFQTDSTLRTNKSNLQSIITSPYVFDEDSQIRSLAQIGISSKATGGSSISQQQLRGYMEIDEKKLDEALANNMDEIKNLFGADTDGDKIIDNGIAYRMDKILQSYVQTGGIIAMKTSSIDRQISAQETRIKRLEDQVADKESNLKRRYGTMESTLNSLQSQANSISNFANQGNSN